jgi:hypothetical protein
METTEAGLNEIVTVEIEYTDGSIGYASMTRREAYRLQNEVVGGKHPGIRRVAV